MRVRLARWLRLWADWLSPPVVTAQTSDHLPADISALLVGPTAIAELAELVDATPVWALATRPAFRVVRVGGDRKGGLKIGPDGPVTQTLGEWGSGESGEASRKFLNEKSYAIQTHNAGLVSLEFWMLDGSEWVVRDRWSPGVGQ